MLLIVHTEWSKMIRGGIGATVRAEYELYISGDGSIGLT